MPPRLAIVQLAPLTVSSGPSARPFAVSSKYISTPAEALATSNFSQRIAWQEFTHNTDGIPFNSILMYPVVSETEGRSIPLIVVPHGGPHSSINNIFIPSYIFLVEALKVGVLFVNYRGSTGFGQDSITSLLGKIGTNDVADIMTSLNSALQLVQQDSAKLKVFDETKVGIVGGSHGGFLGAHMCGQYPNVFKACALRNPVTNIPAMASVTDIPGKPYSHTKNLFNADLTDCLTMFDCV
jgi:acylaminoacyl-peptidase